MPAEAPSSEQTTQLERLQECLALAESQRLANPKLAFTFAKEALQIAQSVGGTAQLGHAERLYARLSADIGQAEDGVRYALSAVRRFEELADERNLGAALSALGVAYMALSSYEDALMTYERAERIAKKLGDRELELRVTGNMSLAYVEINNFDRAGAIMQRALSIAIELGKQDLSVRARSNLGHIELSHGVFERQAGRPESAASHFTKAREVLENALQLPETQSSVFDLGLTRMNLGVVYVEQGQIEAGRTLLIEAHELMQASSDFITLSEGKMYLALAAAWENPERADLTALEAYARSDTPGITQLMRARAWRFLSEAAERCGNFQLAFNAYKKFHELDSSVLNERVRGRAAALALKHDIERAQIEADVLRIHAEHLMDTNTQLSAEASLLSRQAYEDGLTSLSNRRHFDEMFPQLLAQARQDGNGLYVAMADLDHFKKINDTFSHTVGDEVLRQVSAILRAHSRADDLVARYGGEEFVLVLQHANAEQARSACERLRASVEHRNWPALARDLVVTMSIGVAQCDPGKTALANIEAADQLLYQAKREGRNRVCM